MSTIMQIQVSAAQINLLAHMLGVRGIHRCPKEFGRNHFCLGSDDHPDLQDLEQLESKGIVARADHNKEIGGVFYFATDLGKSLLREIRGDYFSCGCGAEIRPEFKTQCFDCWNCEEI